MPNIGAPMQGSDGSFYGVTTQGGANNTGAVYKITPSPALAGPVQLSLTASQVNPGDTVTLKWSVANAFSLTLQQCIASVQGAPTGAGNWSGLQAGLLFLGNGQQVYKGFSAITPTANGVYTYALTCGGRESGFATLTVGQPRTGPRAPTLSQTLFLARTP